MSNPSPPAPVEVIAYESASRLQWVEDGEQRVLIFPRRSQAEVRQQAVTGFVSMTGFLLLVFAAVALFGAAAMIGPVGSAVVVCIGLLAIGVWVMVTGRAWRSVWEEQVSARVSVGPEGLQVMDALPPGPVSRQFPPGSVAGLRLDALRGTIDQTSQVRLQVVTTDGGVTPFKLVWPAGEATEPYEAVLRERLGLPRRKEQAL